MSSRDSVAVLFKAECSYGNVNCMVDALARSLGRLGVAADIVHVGDREDEARLLDLVRSRKVAFFLSVSGFGLPAAGSAFYDDAAAPVFAFFLDHPYCLEHAVRLPLARLAVSFPAPHAVAFCRSFLRDDIAVHHIPHGAEPQKPMPWEERDIAVLFAGTVFAEPGSLRDGWRRHGRQVEATLNDILDLCRRDLARPLEDCVLEVLGEGAGDLQSLLPYMKTIDDYLRNEERVAAVKALRHLPLVVAGGGWPALIGDPGNARFLGEKTSAETLELTAASKIVLNAFPGYNGSHERVFNAMACGAVALTGQSRLFADLFAAGEIVFQAPGALAEQTAALLADDAGLRQVAEKGRAAFMAAHTWDHRAQRILAALAD